MKFRLSKILVIIFSLFLVIVPLKVSAGNSGPGSVDNGFFSYDFYIDRIDLGYSDSAGRIKNAGWPLYWVRVTGGAYNIPTNYIVVNLSGVQVANNMIIYRGQSYMENYYSINTSGIVRLRVNSGSTTVNYSVSGSWAPNAADYGTMP